MLTLSFISWTQRKKNGFNNSKGLDIRCCFVISNIYNYLLQMIVDEVVTHITLSMNIFPYNFKKCVDYAF